ncbi:MAG TPA: M23 family metallopeptidase [Steroidobacteraceae bacterium]|nr:M23 family metallopeptidase [Steroidobacteraceae bacterium]
MNIFVFSQGRSGQSRQFAVTHPATLGALAAIMLAILGTAFAIGMQLGQRTGRALGSQQLGRWSSILADQKSEITNLKRQLQDQTAALAIRIARLDAHVVRIDELGKRLTSMAHIDHRDLNFDEDPPTGGPEGDDDGVSPQIPDLSSSLSELEQRVELRDAQLSALENVMLTRDLNASIRPEGRPVEQGFISSYFGPRTDPITGRQEFHKGVDFAGNAGDTVIAVAAGVVTWAGDRSGYGILVEIDHGKGYVTRYAHNERTLVSVGQTVTRGQPVALMGSTGHSTGPHVHFEVLHNGRQVNPLAFIEQSASGSQWIKGPG